MVASRQQSQYLVSLMVITMASGSTERKPRKSVKSTQTALFEVANVDEQVICNKPKRTKSGKAKKVKKLADYKRTRPAEIKLFGFSTPEERKYANTIELYDFIPKFFWGKSERENGKYLPTLYREFECRGTSYKVTLAPARIGDQDYYPGKREEIVEAALRKLTCDGQGVFLDESASVLFSLTELKNELKRIGHTYSINEIKEALLICTKASIEIEAEDGSTTLVSSMFESLGLRTWKDWQETGQETKCFVQFNSLVTDSIKNGSFRRLNYEKYVSFKGVIARQLYKRMSHHYTQSSLANTYEILLSTIIRDFGLTAYENLRDNLQKLKLSLKELKDKETVLESKIEKVIDENGKLLDAKIIIRPHPRFTGEMIASNDTQRRIKASLTSFQPKK